MLISEDLKNIDLPLDNDLKLEITNPSTKVEDFLDSLLRITHPETLSVVSPFDSEFLKVFVVPLQISLLEYSPLTIF